MNSPLDQNYYELLEIPRDATLAEIERAYERAQAYYGAGSVAVYALVSPDELKRVQERIDEAYLILSDDAARGEYDSRLGPPGPGERPLRSEVLRTKEQKPPGPEPEPAPEAAVAPATNPMKSEARSEPAAEAQTAPEPPAPEPKSAPEPEPAPPAVEVKVELPPQEPAPPPEPPKTTEPESKPEPARIVAEGPLPPPPMAQPEPAPRVTPGKREVKPGEGTPRPQKPEVPADAVFSGELLRQLREAQGLSLQEIADRTKIGKPHLENIEADRFAALPAQVYLRGFLMSLARELRLDPLRVSKSYLEQMGEAGGRAAAKPRS